MVAESCHTLIAFLAVALAGSALGASATPVHLAGAAGLRAQYFSNAVLLGEPACTTLSPAPANLHLDAAALKNLCGGALSPELFSARFHGQLQLPPGSYQMKTESNGALRLWVHGWKLVDDFTSRTLSSETIGKYNFTVVAGQVYPVRVDLLFTALPATLTISYREVGTSAWKQLEPVAFRSVFYEESSFPIEGSSFPIEESSFNKQLGSAQRSARMSRDARTCRRRLPAGGIPGTEPRPWRTFICRRLSALTSQ